MVVRCLSFYFYIIHKLERERERVEGRAGQEKREEEEGWGRVCADKQLKFIQACK